jgi:hypothetical protein
MDNITLFTYPLVPPSLWNGDPADLDMDAVVTVLKPDGSTLEQKLGFLEDGDVYFTRLCGSTAYAQEVEWVDRMAYLAGLAPTEGHSPQVLAAHSGLRTKAPTGGAQ